MVVVGTIDIPIASFLVFLTIAMSIFFSVLIYLVLKTNVVERHTQEIQAKLTKQEHILKDEVDALRVLVEPIQYVSTYYKGSAPPAPAPKPSTSFTPHQIPAPKPSTSFTPHQIPAQPLAHQPLKKVPPAPHFPPPKSPTIPSLKPAHLPAPPTPQKPLTLLDSLKPKSTEDSKLHLPHLFKKKKA